MQAESTQEYSVHNSVNRLASPSQQRRVQTPNRQNVQRPRGGGNGVNDHDQNSHVSGCDKFLTVICNGFEEIVLLLLVLSSVVHQSLVSSFVIGLYLLLILALRLFIGTKRRMISNLIFHIFSIVGMLLVIMYKFYLIKSYNNKISLDHSWISSRQSVGIFYNDEEQLLLVKSFIFESVALTLFMLLALFSYTYEQFIETNPIKYNAQQQFFRKSETKLLIALIGFQLISAFMLLSPLSLLSLLLITVQLCITFKNKKYQVLMVQSIQILAIAQLFYLLLPPNIRNTKSIDLRIPFGDLEEVLSDDNRVFTYTLLITVTTFVVGIGNLWFQIPKNFDGSTNRSELTESLIQEVINANEKRQLVLKFSPWVLLWIARVGFFFIIYMYHCYQSLFLLLAMLGSFLVSLETALAISIYLLLPILIIQFTILYFYNIPSLDIKQDQVFDHFYVKLNIPQLELVIFFSLLTVFCLMISAYRHLLKKKNLLKDYIFGKVLDPDSFVIWKLSFFLMKYLHLLVLIFLLINGMKESLQSIIYMLFFIIYCSTNLYRSTSNYLVGVTAIFIWGQYYYSIKYHDYQLHHNEKDLEILRILDFIDWTITVQSESEMLFFYPNFQQYAILVTMAMLHAINGWYYDTEFIQDSENLCINQIRDRYPKTVIILIRFKQFIQQFVAIVVLTTMTYIEITTYPNLINWGFVFISLIFLWIIIAGKYSVQSKKRSSYMASFLSIFAAVVLLVSVGFFLFSKFYQLDQDFGGILNLLIAHKELFGLKSYNGEQTSSLIWDNYKNYLIFLLFGGYLKAYYNTVAKYIQNEQEYSYTHNFPKITEVNKYYEDNKYSLPYLLYKIRGSWGILNSIALNFHIITNLLIIYLAINYELSLFMAVNIALIVIYYMYSSIKMHTLSNKSSLQGEISLQQARFESKEFKISSTQTFIQAKRKVWHYQFGWLLASISLLYPTVAVTTEAINFSQSSIQYLFWCGIYRKDQGFDSIIVQVVIMILLILERISYRWTADKFGCSLQTIERFCEVEKRRAFYKAYKFLPEYFPLQHTWPYKFIPQTEIQNVLTIVSDKFQECEYQHKRQLLITSYQQNEQSDEQFKQQQTQLINEKTSQDQTYEKQILKVRINKLIESKSNFKKARFSKLIVETICLGLLCISAVFKANIISIIYSMSVLFYLMKSKKLYPMIAMSIVISVSVVGQYTIALLNMMPRNSPRQLPQGDLKGETLFFPIIFHSEYLKNNIDVAYYLAMGIEQLSTLVSFWFDFSILCLVTQYLLNFRNPVLSSRVSKIHWQETQSIFESSNDYDEDNGDRQKMHKQMDVIKAIERYNVLINSDNDENLSDSERFREMKSINSVYNTSKRMHSMIYLVFPIFTIVFVLFFALLNYALIAFGYVIALLPQFFKIKKMLTQGKQEKWSFINTTCYFLISFTFIDFLLQVFFQAPSNIHQYNYVLGLVGLKQTWSIQEGLTYDEISQSSDVKLYIYYDNMLYILFMKCIMLTIISLQKEIFQSNGYQKFISQSSDHKKGLQLLLSMKQDKKIAIDQNFNNLKLRDLTAMKKQNQNILETIKDLKEKVSNWRSYMTAFVNNEQPQIEPHQIKLESNRGVSQNEYSSAANINSTFFQEDLSLLNQEAKHFVRKNRNQLSTSTRFLIYLNRHYTNQILFINKREQLDQIRQEISNGEKIMITQIEQLMIKDAKIFIEKENYNSNTKISVEKDMPSLKESLTRKYLFNEWISTIFKILASNTHNLAYLFMINSMIQNAGAISIGYPMAVFGYAIMEERGPGIRFWNLIIYYTLMILITKYTIQLTVFSGVPDPINQDDVRVTAHYDNVIIQIFSLLGLKRNDDTQSTLGLIRYMLPEVIIMLLVLGHQIKDKLLGVSIKSKVGQETIMQAISRIRKNIEKEEDTIEYEQNDKHSNSFSNDKTSKVTLSQQLDKESFKPVIKRQYSQIFDEKEMKEVKRSFKSKTRKGFFGKIKYFKRIFPTLLAQKPGKDFYFEMTFFLFVICVFIITNYSSLSPSQWNISSVDLIDSSMITFLFIHILFIIVERLINRSETKRKHRVAYVKSYDLQKHLELAVADRLRRRQSIQLARRESQLNQQHLLQQPQMSRKGTLQQNNQLMNEILHPQEEGHGAMKIEIDKTQITGQQICKYFFHWFLLILVHILVFWYFPAIQCPEGQEECENSKNSGYLNCFYLLYCVYFSYSALQIRFGYPLLRNASSTMQDNQFSYYGHMVQQQFPFLLELKVLLDWTFTKTSLQLEQFFQLVYYHSSLYTFKMSNRDIYNKKFGQTITPCNKCLNGWLCLMFIFICIFAPIIFFSDFGVFSDFNPITKSQFEVSLKVLRQHGEGSFTQDTYLLYSLHNASIYNINELEYEQLRDYKQTDLFEPEQIQKSVLGHYSDVHMLIPESKKDKLKQDLKLYLANASKPQNLQVFLDITYEFHRIRPDDAKKSHGKVETYLNLTEIETTFHIMTKNGANNVTYIDYQYQDTIISFIKALEIDCSESSTKQAVDIANSYVDKVRLSDAVTIDTTFMNLENDQNRQFQDMKMEYSCENAWSLSDENSLQIEIFTYSSKVVDSMFADYSLITFFLFVVYTIFQAVRSIVLTPIHQAFMNEINDPDKLLMLCEYIHLLRRQRLHDKEEEYYHLLVEILRQPELMKQLTGSSLKGELLKS